MQGLVTDNYRGGNRWPTSAEDEEDGYPLFVPFSRSILVPHLFAVFQPSGYEGPFQGQFRNVRRKHSRWWQV